MAHEPDFTITPLNQRPAIREICFLDDLMSMDEEPWEISYVVATAGERCTTEFFVWLSAKGICYPANGLRNFLNSLFDFTYIQNWSRHSRIAKLSKEKMKAFLAPYGGKEIPETLSAAELLMNFFRFLYEAGYEVDLNRLLRAAKNAEGELIRARRGRGRKKKDQKAKGTAH